MSGSDYAMRLKTTGRNERCPCGSGRKYKQCHLAEDESARTVAADARREEARAARAAEDTDGKGNNKPPSKNARANLKKKQPGSKGRGLDGKPKNIARRGAV